MADRAITGTIEEVAEEAQRILRSVVPDGYCQAQEWDNRIDCMVNLSDGSFAGEMVILLEASENRIRETGERLKKRQQGLAVELKNELWPPILIARGPAR
jgi:hypothetical protein